MLDQKTLNELFEYDDGNLYWKIQPAMFIKIGEKAGYIAPKIHFRLGEEI